MLFSITPKSRRDKLFDFENELNSLVKSIGLNPMTIVIGMRRMDKTSLLKVALNECGYPYIYIDPGFLPTRLPRFCLLGKEVSRGFSR